MWKKTVVVAALFSIVLATVMESLALASASSCGNPPMPTVTDKSIKQVPSMAFFYGTRPEEWPSRLCVLR